MSITYETVGILIFLAPGFLASLLLKSFTTRKDKPPFSLLIEAVIFSFFIYLISVSILKISVSTIVDAASSSDLVHVTILNTKFLFVVAAISIVLPVIAGYMFTYDIHMKVFRFVKATKLTSRENVWIQAFSDYGDHLVVVHFSDRRRAIGLPTHYSSNPSERMLYLSKAAWINDGNYQPIEGKGLLIVEEDSIWSVEFLHKPKPKLVTTQTPRNNAA